MKRSEMNDLVMKAHSEGVYVEDVFEEAYQQGRADAVNEYTCHDDCTNEDCTMCVRWNKLADCYEKEQKN